VSENRNHYGKPLTVAMEHGALVIRIGAHTLAHAVSLADWANPYDHEKGGDYIRTFAITDAVAFAKDVQRAILDEREDGSSPLSDFLDKMTEAAVDDGSEACEFDQHIKHGTTAAIETWAASLSSPRGGRTRTERTTDDVARPGELDEGPTPQHAATDEKG
jgi:hypothetical protein